MFAKRILSGVGASLVACACFATEVQVFRSASQSAFLSGTLESISVDPLGALRLAHRAERLTAIEEPFLFSAARTADGWLAGTGNAGRIVKIARDGTTSTLFETEEPEVFAVWVDDDGTVFAGSSPDGKVYRYRDGERTVLFDPAQKYIWKIVRVPGGDLLVATGTEGKIFKVQDDGTSELLYDSEDTHIRSLLPMPDGSLLVGTAGQGLVLQINAQGRARTLYDAAAPEVLDLVLSPEGGAYFAALGSESSLVDLTRRSSNSSGNGNGEDKKEASEVQGSESSQPASSGSRISGFRGPRSEILYWNPNGAVSKIWLFEEETVFEMLLWDDRLWVATGLEGKLFSYRNEQMVLEKDVEEAQIVTLLEGETGPVFLTTNAAALYRFVAGNERSGTLTSAVLDAKRSSHFGSLHWDGNAPTGTSVEFSFRAGMSKQPDDTWSDWTSQRGGNEIALGDLDASRYLQWRLHLRSDNGDSPEVRTIEVSYRQLNEKPEIESLTAMDPGQILVPTNFNPSNQIYEPAHPNREGIFTTIGAPARRENRSTKTLWKGGYRTLQWKAEDPNGDELRYALAFRREDDSDGWLEMADQLEDEHYSFDSTVLPDGRYRFRLQASDHKGNADGEDLLATRISDQVVVDHSPPELGRVESGGSLKASATDLFSPLREAVYSVDAKEWRPAVAADGLIDGRSETFILEINDNARLLLLRLTDAHFNVITHDLTSYLP